MRTRTRLASLVATVLVATGLGAEPAAAQEPVTVDVLGVNDFHGRLEADGQAAGAAVLAGAVNTLRAENPNTVFAAAGDLIGASTFTSFIQDDNPTIDALTEAGLEVSAVGNHEFDKGYADLVNRVVPRAGWQYLGANVEVEPDSDLPPLADSWVTDVGGVKVGFVGAVTSHLPELVTPAGISMLDVLDPVTEANRVADEMKASGAADVVVLLVHEGAATTSLESATDPDSDFGRIVNGASPNIDAIVSGHTHLAYEHMVPVQEWIDEGQPVTSRPVVSAGQYGFFLDKVSLTFDTASGQVTGVDTSLLPLTIEVDGEWQPNPIYPPDPEVAQIVADAVEVAEVEGARPLGEITSDFNRARQADGTTENRGGESTLGNLVADVQLASAQVTDPATQIAFMNPGGLRDDMTYASSGPNDPDGTVTYREAAEVQPFANTLVTMTLTGAQVVAVLEEQWQPAGASRPFLKLGVSKGLDYTYDPVAAAGEHVTSVALDGEPLDPEGTYRVVVNSFLASGGDNFATLAEGADARDTGQIDLQSMVDHLADNSPLSPDPAQRAVGVRFDPAPPADGYAPGDTVTVRLSSLVFTTNEPKDEKVTATLDGAAVGTFAVDATADAAQNGTDERGLATVTFEVPESATSPTSQLVVKGDVTGTTASISVPVADTSCTTTVSGRHDGPLNLDSDTTCVDDATVTGPVTVGSGATLLMTDSRVRGPVSGSGADGVTISDSRVSGPVSITGIDGTVVLDGTTVRGPVRLDDNTGPPAAVVSGNTIHGPLACSGNAPPPTDAGQPNTVKGPKSGQCAAL